MTGAARLSRGVRPAWRAAGKESPGASCAFWAASLGRQSGAISHLAQRREVKPTASISLKKKKKKKENESPGYTPPPEAWGSPQLRFPGTCVPERWCPGQDSRTSQKNQQALPGGGPCTEDSVPLPRF